jgi:hypothetical protein
VVVAMVIAVWWLYDIRQDRRHVVLVRSETPVFAGAGDWGCGGTQLTVIQAGVSLRAQRIRYWKNCATIDVVLPNGRAGYIVLGQGEVSVNPSLP